MKRITYKPGANPNPGPAVLIVCDDASHEGRIALLTMYVRPPDGRWLTFPVKSAKAHGGNWTMQYLDGDHLLTEDERKALQPGWTNPIRQREEIRCPLCGDSLPVRRENIVPILDRLAEHADRWELELSALRARLIK